MADIATVKVPMHRKHVPMPVLVFLLVGVAVIIAAGAYQLMRNAGSVGNAVIPPIPAPAPAGTEVNIKANESEDLGTSLYQNSQNPINDKLPDNTASVPNPLEGAYKNPFE